MSIDFLNSMMIPVIVGICLCIGYVLKQWQKIPNKSITTILAVIGVVIALWINKWVATPEIILSGLVSGLGSSGLYDTYKDFFVNRKIGSAFDDQEELENNTDEELKDGDEDVDH